MLAVCMHGIACCSHTMACMAHADAHVCVVENNPSNSWQLLQTSWQAATCNGKSSQLHRGPIANAPQHLAGAHAACVAVELEVWRWEGLLVAFPVIAYGFTAHQFLFGIYTSLKAPTVRRMSAVVQKVMFLGSSDEQHGRQTESTSTQLFDVAWLWPKAGHEACCHVLTVTGHAGGAVLCCVTPVTG